MGDAAENLARAERMIEQGFANDAVAYALISLAHSLLNEVEEECLPDEREDARKRRWGGPGSAI